MISPIFYTYADLLIVEPEKFVVTVPNQLAITVVEGIMVTTSATTMPYLDVADLIKSLGLVSAWLET